MFLDERTCKLTFRDVGFGEFFTPDRFPGGEDNSVRRNQWGSLILCHSKRAKRPYEISRVHMRIYTIEELCYYLCNNLYLIDYTIMNRRLCDWLEDELGLAKMAEDLRRDLDQNATLEEFVLTILKDL